MKVQNKVLWITGASSGIGEALAKEAYKRGASLILSARREKKLQEVSLEMNPERVLILPLDLSEHRLFPGKVEEAYNRWGRVDILFNNGGISQRSLLEDTEYSVIRSIMDINFIGTAALTREVIPRMIEQKQGYILAVSSVAGKFSTPLRSIYSASKMALQGFLDGIRAELWSKGIKVSLVVPGFVRTEISLNALEGSGEKHQKMDPNQESGISSEQSARDILKGMDKEKREIFTGWVPKLRVAYFLSRNFPGVLAKMMRKADVT